MGFEFTEGARSHPPEAGGRTVKTKVLCYFCQEEVGGEFEVENIPAAVTGKVCAISSEPCAACTHLMKTHILAIMVDDDVTEHPIRGPHNWPSPWCLRGYYAVRNDEVTEWMSSLPEEIRNRVLKRRYIFVRKSDWESAGLPPGCFD